MKKKKKKKKKKKNRFKSLRLRGRVVVYALAMDAITLTRQLVDIESISGNEAAVGNYLYGELCRIGYQTRRMPVDRDRFNVTRRRRSSRIRRWFSPRTWTQFLRSYNLLKTQRAFTDAGRAMPRALLRRRSLPRNDCGARQFTSDCCSWLAKSATAWARKRPTSSPRVSQRMDANTWSTANPRRTASHWLRKGRCEWR